MLLFAILVALLSSADSQLLQNPGFTDGLKSWLREAPATLTIEPALEDGVSVLKFTVPADVPLGYPHVYQSFPAAPGVLFEGAAGAKSITPTNAYGFYLSIDFYDADNKRISYSQSDAAIPDHIWIPLKARAAAPPGTTSVRFNLVFNGTGEGLFRNPAFRIVGNTEVPPLSGPVIISVTDQKSCEHFKGFGAEDDGWFYNPENAARGVNEDDYRLHEERIRWMDPDWQRMFFWCKDWNPSGDWETFDFNTPNMLSHYRTLDLYQQIGAVVNAVGVEWFAKQPYTDVVKVSRAITSLLEHLIKSKGYTCIQEWTLTNEPNGRLSQMGISFDDFIRLHALVKEELARRNLPVRIIGSDDTNGWAWFSACANDPGYFATADIFASHRYLPFADRNMMSFFVDDRLRLLQSKTPLKPFVVGEFGFQDGRSGTFENPVMETYPYAVWTQAFVLEGLNQGVSGFSIWCMNEVHYPLGPRMTYGLWNYKDRNWQVRPVYHSWANFCRLTEPGDPVYRCESSSPAHVLAARVGNTLFWVNRAEQMAQIKFNNVNLGPVRVMAEVNLSGDRECGDLVTPTDNVFSAPPQSFGYATVM